MSWCGTSASRRPPHGIFRLRHVLHTNFLGWTLAKIMKTDYCAAYIDRNGETRRGGMTTLTGPNLRDSSLSWLPLFGGETSAFIHFVMSSWNPSSASVDMPCCIQSCGSKTSLLISVKKSLLLVTSGLLHPILWEQNIVTNFCSNIVTSRYFWFAAPNPARVKHHCYESLDVPMPLGLLMARPPLPPKTRSHHVGNWAERTVSVGEARPSAICIVGT